MKDFIFEENTISNLSKDEKIKNLSNTVLNTKIQAEIDKLNNEENELNSRNIFSKFFGKLDGSTAFKQENINFQRFVINDKLNRNSISKDNVDLHSVLADIELFMEDNKYNELISEEIEQLNNINKYIYNNFEINSDKINNFVTNRKQCFLPALTKKVTKYEQLKHETIKYLNKQGYNK